MPRCYIIAGKYFSNISISILTLAIQFSIRSGSIGSGHVARAIGSDRYEGIPTRIYVNLFTICRC